MDDIEIDGVRRDVRHLRRFMVELPGKGKDGASLRVQVRLGLHTISRGCEPGEQGNLIDENGSPRVFCEDRYAFSLGLPELMKRMIEQKYYCWESKDRNRAMNYAILDAAPGRIGQVADGEHQVVFFYLYPGNGQESDVQLVITSCHMRFMRVAQRRYDLHMVLRTCLYKGKRLP